MDNALRRFLQSRLTSSLIAMAAALACAETCLTQAEPVQPVRHGAPARRFHLPAGDYPLAEIVGMAEQSMRCRIQVGDATAAGEPLRLQTPLALDEQAWQIVLGTLLWSRGLVLVTRPGGDGFEVLPTPTDMAPWIEDAAVECSPGDLHAQHPFGPVKVTLPIGEQARKVQDVITMLFFMRNRSCIVGGVPGAITIAGLGCDVRRAAETLAEIVPGLLPPRPDPAVWPRPHAEVHELRQGTSTARDLVDRLANALHRNVVGPADGEFLDVPITVETTQRLDAARYEDEVTRLLWKQRILLVELVPGRGLFQAMLVPKDQPMGGVSTPTPVATPMTVGEVMARRDLVAFVSVPVRFAHISYQDARDAWEERNGAEAQLIQKRKQGRGPCQHPDLLLTYSPSANTFRVKGLTCDLMPVLEKWAAMEQAAKDGR